jgi:hypothetical protein
MKYPEQRLPNISTQSFKTSRKTSYKRFFGMSNPRINHPKLNQFFRAKAVPH